MGRFLIRTKRILTGILTIAVIATSFPSYAYATETENNTDEVVLVNEPSESNPTNDAEEGTVKMDALADEPVEETQEPEKQQNAPAEDVEEATGDGSDQILSEDSAEGDLTETEDAAVEEDQEDKLLDAPPAKFDTVIFVIDYNYIDPREGAARLSLMDLKPGKTYSFLLADKKKENGWEYYDNYCDSYMTPDANGDIGTSSLEEGIRNRFGDDAFDGGNANPDKITYELLYGSSVDNATVVEDGTGPITLEKKGIGVKITRNTGFDMNKLKTGKYYIRVKVDYPQYITNYTYTAPIVDYYEPTEDWQYCNTKEEAYEAVRKIIRDRINNIELYQAENTYNYKTFVYDCIWVKDGLFGAYPIYMIDVCDFEAERDGMKPYEGDYMYNLIGNSHTPEFYYEDPNLPHDKYDRASKTVKENGEDEGTKYSKYEVYLPVITTEEQETALDEEVKRILARSDFKAVENGTNDQKIRVIYNYVRSTVNSATGDRTVPIKHTAYNALCTSGNQGTCEAYAQSFCRLAREMGVSAKVIMGLDANNHTYNIVKRDDGKWWYIDCDRGIYLSTHSQFSHAPLQDRYKTAKYNYNYWNNVASYPDSQKVNMHSVSRDDEEVFVSASIEEVHEFVMDDAKTHPDSKYLIKLGGNCTIEKNLEALDFWDWDSGKPIDVDVDLNRLELNLRSMGRVCVNEIRNGTISLAKAETFRGGVSGYSASWIVVARSMKDISVTGYYNADRMVFEEFFDEDHICFIDNVSFSKIRFRSKIRMTLKGNATFNNCQAVDIGNYSIVKKDGRCLGRVIFKGTNVIGWIGSSSMDDDYFNKKYKRTPISVTAVKEDNSPTVFEIGDIIATNQGTLKYFASDDASASAATFDDIYDKQSLCDAANKDLEPDNQLTLKTTVGKDYVFGYPSEFALTFSYTADQVSVLKESEDVSLKLNSSNQISDKPGRTLKFRAVAKPGYKVIGVTAGNDTIQQDEDGKYSVAFDADKKITISSVALPGVTVSTKVDEKEPAAASATVTYTGLSSGKTANKAVKLTFKPAAGRFLTEVKYDYEGLEGDPIVLKPVSTNVYEIPADVINDATKAQKGIFVTVYTDIQVFNVLPASDSSNKVKFFEYKKETGPVWSFDPMTVEYGQEIYLYAKPDDDCTITSIKVGSTTLKASTEKVGDSIFKYYTVPASIVKDTIRLKATVSNMLPFKIGADDQEKEISGCTVYFDDCAVSVTTKGAVYEDGWFKVPAKPGTISYTIETKGDFLIQSATIGETAVTIPAKALNKAKDGFVYTVSETASGAAKYSGETLTVVAESKPRVVTVNKANLDKDKLLVKENGKKLDNTAPEGAPEFSYSISNPFSNVVVCAEPAPGYSLKSATVDGKSAKLSKGSVSFMPAVSCSADGTCAVSFESEGVLTTWIENGEGDAWTVPVANKATLDLRDKTPTNTLIVSMTKGAALVIDKCSVSPEKAVSGGNSGGIFAYTDGNKDKVKLDLTTVTDGSKPISVTLYATESGKTISCTFKLIVRQDITQVSIKGEKKDSDGKYVIDQPAGTKMSYDITLNENSDIYELAPNYDPTMLKAWIDPATKKLWVETFVDFADPEDANHQITKLTTESTESTESTDIKLYRRSPAVSGMYSGLTNEDIAGLTPVKTIKVNPTKTEFAAPTVTLKNVSDVDAVLSLALPKKFGDYKNVVYKVTAEAANKPAPTSCMAEGGTWYYMTNSGELAQLQLAYERNGDFNTETEESESNVRLTNTPAVMGNGQKQKYDLSVQLIQVSETKDNKINPNDYKVFSVGKEKKLTAETRDLSYETKMGFKKNQTTVTQGETNVLLGIATFSKTTSYTEIDPGESYIIDSEGMRWDDLIDKGTDGSVIIKDTSEISVGKATAYIAPRHGDNTQYTHTTVAITVKAPIDMIDLSPATTKLYKVDGKAATLKFTAGTFWDGDDNDADTKYKAASNKVLWSIEPVDPNSPLKDYVTIKNGTVTVAKDYVLSATTEQKKDYDKFRVTVTAADFTGNTKCESTIIELISEPLVIDSVTIVDDADYSLDLGGEISSEDLIGKRLSINNGTIELSDVVIKVSDAKSFVIDEETGEILDIKKSGNFTVTVTANDGSKKTFKQVVKVKAGTPEGFDFTAKWWVGSETDAEVINFSNPGEKQDEYEAISPMSGATYLEFVSDATVDSVFTNNATISVSGGSKVAESVDGKTKKLIIKPKAGTEKITVTHKYKIGKTDHTDKYTIAVQKKSITIKPRTVDIYSNAENKYGRSIFEVSGIEEVPSPNVYKMVFALPDKAYQGKDVSVESSIVDQLNENEFLWALVGTERKLHAEIIGPISNIPKGKYSLYATLCGPDGSPVSNPVAVTVNTSDAKTPSAALDVDVKKPVGVSKKINTSVGIRIKTLKYSHGIVPSSVKVYNNNNNGKPNEFTKYFSASAVPRDEGAYVQHLNIVRTDVPIPESISAEDLTGWVSYDVIGYDYKTVTHKTEMVTVKFVDTTELRVNVVDENGDVYGQPNAISLVHIGGIVKGEDGKYYVTGENMFFKLDTQYDGYELEVRFKIEDAEAGSAPGYNNHGSGIYDLDGRVPSEAIKNNKALIMTIRVLSEP